METVRGAGFTAVETGRGADVTAVETGRGAVELPEDSRGAALLSSSLSSYCC